MREIIFKIACGIYWKKARRAKRKSQRTPIACQYQAAPSTRIWRDSELAGDVEADEGGDERGDAEEEMDGVDAGDQIEEVAALVGAEEDVLDG